MAKTNWADGNTVRATDMNDLGAEVNGKQPLNAGLTAIAGLTTTAFGRSLLTTDDADAVLPDELVGGAP